MSRDVLKDPYVFDFLPLGNETLERDIERALLQNISRFLVEMGSGFAFMGSQYHLSSGGGRPGFLHRPALLPAPAALPGGGRIEDRGIRAGVCREDKGKDPRVLGDGLPLSQRQLYYIK